MTLSRTLSTTADGTELATHALAGDDTLLVGIHGFSGSLDDIQPLIASIRSNRSALLVDVIGHGSSVSPEHVEPYSMASVVDQILSLIGPREPGTVHLIGYSMGGRIALSMASRAPWYFGSVTSLSATAGIDDPVERAARHDRDHELATHLEAVGVDRFTEEWLDLPLFAPFIGSLGPDALAALHTQRRANSARGLANSLRGTGTGSMPPVWDRLAGLYSPLLAIAGSLDPTYVDHAERLATTVPDGRSVVVEAGHVVHRENPEAVASVVMEFLESCDQRRQAHPNS